MKWGKNTFRSWRDTGNFFNMQTLLWKLWNALISDNPDWDVLSF